MLSGTQIHDNGWGKKKKLFKNILTMRKTHNIIISIVYCIIYIYLQSNASSFIIGKDINKYYYNII